MLTRKKGGDYKKPHSPIGKNLTWTYHLWQKIKYTKEHFLLLSHAI